MADQNTIEIIDKFMENPKPQGEYISDRLDIQMFKNRFGVDLEQDEINTRTKG